MTTKFKQVISSISKMQFIQRSIKYIGILIIPLASSCSTTSALIQADDDAFLKAQNHFQRMEERVDQQHPSASERSLFLQAEGFYQYRFTPPSKSKAKYLAEAASAITDFPGFQSLAGSLDMEDLRFRSSDSAVQLWESLLQQYPQTSLKSLTLYRLGWAYRNVGAQGLPRSSPNEPLSELIHDYPHLALANLARKAENIPWKSKKEAGFRSLIPGMGQMYLDENQSGFTRLGIAVAGLIAVALPVYNATHGNNPSFSSTAMGLGGLIMLSFDFTDSYEDAIHGVVLWNEKAESYFQKHYPTAP